MKTLFLSIFMFVISMLSQHDEVMRKEGSTYIIDTTTLCDRKGYKDKTPVEVYIQNGRVVKIVALPNMESKGYFNPMVRKLFSEYENLKVGKAKSMSKNETVDATTGATYSGRAVQANINSALQYYERNK